MRRRLLVLCWLVTNAIYVTGQSDGLLAYFYTRDHAIALAEVKAVKVSDYRPSYGTATVQIQQILRGDVPKGEITLPFSSTGTDKKGRPFAGIHGNPITGHKVLLMFYEAQPASLAPQSTPTVDEGLDVTEYPQILADVKKAIEIDSLSAEKRETKLLTLLNDPSVFFRSYALWRIVAHGCASRSRCVHKAVAIEEPSLLGRTKERRLEALSALNLFFPVSRDNADRQRIAELVIETIPDVQVRDDAVLIANEMLSTAGGSVSAADLNIRNREQVISALEQERQHSGLQKTASRLLKQLSTQ